MEIIQSNREWVRNGYCCEECGGTVIICQAENFDYWWYCSRKDCRFHHGELTYDTQWPSWVIKQSKSPTSNNSTEILKNYICRECGGMIVGIEWENNKWWYCADKVCVFHSGVLMVDENIPTYYCKKIDE